ncbi:MAG TPA: zinc ribbon domain-containing protein [Chloroflexia bacterium]|nr:zinc ribbon domain-containing protein [Chloroflexia bacterium]
MSQQCPTCGFENRLTNRFCSNCGTALATASAAAPGATTPQHPAGQPSPGFMPPPGEQAAENVAYRVQRWEGAEQPVVPPPPPEGPSFLPPPYNPPAESRAAVPPPPPYAGARPETGRTAERASGPPSEMRGEGGTYLPYAAEVVRTLEEKRPERSWLVPAVVGLAVVLVVLVAVAGYLWLSGNGGDNTTAGITTPGTGQQTTTSGSEVEIIKEVIRKSNDEQIQAWRELNTEVLTGTRTGQVLQENIDAVEQLRARNMYAVPVNHRIEFGKITINGDEATAETLEEWTVTFYRQSDDKVLEKDGPRLLSEVYFLVKVDGKWLISELVITDAPEPTPAPGEVSALP